MRVGLMDLSVITAKEQERVRFKLASKAMIPSIILMSQSKNNISALELKRQLGVNYQSAWRVKHKLMQVMVERESVRVFQGNVVIDDAYLGGEHKGKAGRGPESKVPFVAAVELSEKGHPLVARFDRIGSFSKLEIGRWAKCYLSELTQVVSDGLNCFPAVTEVGAVHFPEVAGKGRCSIDIPCFSWINILLGNLKTTLTRTYHAFKYS